MPQDVPALPRAPSPPRPAQLALPAESSSASSSSSDDEEHVVVLLHLSRNSWFKPSNLNRTKVVKQLQLRLQRHLGSWSSCAKDMILWICLDLPMTPSPFCHSQAAASQSKRPDHESEIKEPILPRYLHILTNPFLYSFNLIYVNGTATWYCNVSGSKRSLMVSRPMK